MPGVSYTPYREIGSIPGLRLLFTPEALLWYNSNRTPTEEREQFLRKVQNLYTDIREKGRPRRGRVKSARACECQFSTYDCRKIGEFSLIINRQSKPKRTLSFTFWPYPINRIFRHVWLLQQSIKSTPQHLTNCHGTTLTAVLNSTLKAQQIRNSMPSGKTSGENSQHSRSRSSRWLEQ